MSHRDDNPDLVTVLEKLREDLSEAKFNAKADPDGPILNLGKVEIEIELAIQNTVEGGGGIKFSVLTFGARRNRAKGATHRLKLELNPIGEQGVASGEHGEFDTPPPDVGKR
ncbi:hypothetical protein OV450_7607 [Actinobacteria bacterium OV450]|nr:hypothetical protein OV450_7607 [Actinobacteria bacterium OV450]